MKLVIGLGNPTNKYKNNRHNVGYIFIDYLLNELTGSITTPNVSGLMGLNFKILKTDCFMNVSGEFVKKLLKKHQNIKLQDLYIVHDDLDIPLGKFKIDHATGPKLHNGIKSIEETLKTKDFWRIRIGVDARKQGSWIDGEKYVLSDFTKEERTEVLRIFEEIIIKLTSSFII